MHPYTRLEPAEFDALIDRSAENRMRMISLTEIRLLLPPPKQCPDGLWKNPTYVALDAVLVALGDLIVGQRGSTRKVITEALPLLQFALLANIDRPEDVWVGIVQYNGAYQVMVGTPQEIAADSAFLSLPGSSRAWFANLRRAVDIVRQRATKHNVKLPSRFTLEAEEARDEIAAALAARRAHELKGRGRRGRAAR